MGIINCHFRETYPAIKRDKRTLLALVSVNSSFRNMLIFNANRMILRLILLFVEEEVVLLWIVRPEILD